MHKAGRFAVIAGILLIVIGMVIGFTLLFKENENAIIWLGTIIPLGFIVLLTGMVTTLLSQRSDDD
ncbi:MAG: hypothetical protein OEW99_13575 [Gammaproteobacteria bacterium]|nr:hypothetical protein [Gammaproteobacteria bacterium]